MKSEKRKAPFGVFSLLNEFLKKREVELMDMMDYLYNDEIIMRNHDAQLVRESEIRARNNILAEMVANGEITATQAAKYQRV